LTERTIRDMFADVSVHLPANPPTHTSRGDHAHS
jgi:hypothetical protein